MKRRITQRTRILIVGLAVASFGLSACAATAPSATQSTDSGKLRVVYGVYDSKLGFAQAIVESLEKAAKDSGVELTVLDNGGDAGKTVANARTAATLKPDVFIESSPLTNNDQIVSIMKDAGVPLMSVQVPIPGVPIFTVDNPAAGKLSGEGLAKVSKERWPDTPPSTAMILNSQQSGGDLTKALGVAVEDAIVAAYPDIEVVQGDNKTDSNVAAQVTTSFLTSHPDGKLLLWTNLDQFAIAASNAAKTAGREDDILIAGYGGDPATVPFIKSGVMAGTLALNPQLWGPEILELAKKLAAGEKIPETTNPTSVQWVDESNVDTALPTQ